MSGRRRPLQSCLMVLAALALAVQVLIPGGFMLARPDGSGPQIVICTGHGPLIAPDLGKSKAPAPRDRPATPCVFGGHGAGAPTPALAPPAARIAWTTTAVVTPTPADQAAVGRGLAAPPPARGPPTPLA